MTSCTIEPKVNGLDCPILWLPNEILSRILRSAIHVEYNNSYRPRPRLTAQLSNTCQPIRNLVIPEMYSNVRIRPLETLESRTPTSRLRPDFRRYCKKLAITITRVSRFPKLELMTEFLSCFSKTRHLTINCYIEKLEEMHEYLSALIRTALRNFPNLTTLSLRELHVITLCSR